MDWLQALILGLVQGLTEYLPVSSSGHLAIGAHIFGLNGEENLTFTVAVHVATVLSTLVILWGEIKWLFHGLLKGRMNDETRYALNIVVSMIPVGIVGVFFKDKVEQVFGSGLAIVGAMLLVTAFLLAFSYYYRPQYKAKISMPGLSRSGSTIATGLLLGNDKAKLAQFSFLMVIPPILGEALLDIIKAARHGAEAAVGSISTGALAIGFTAAFLSGCFACRWMIDIVKRGKLVYFAIYCAAVGVITLLCSFFF